MTLVSELKRRNVHRAAAAYVALSWLLIQIAETVLPAFGFGSRPVRAVIIALIPIWRRSTAISPRRLGLPSARWSGARMI